MEIHTKSKLNSQTIENLCCGVCGKKFQEGDKIRPFGNREIYEYWDKTHLIDGKWENTECRNIFVKDFHTNYNQHKIYIGECCFKPEIFPE